MDGHNDWAFHVKIEHYPTIIHFFTVYHFKKDLQGWRQDFPDVGYSFPDEVGEGLKNFQDNNMEYKTCIATPFNHSRCDMRMASLITVWKHFEQQAYTKLM